MLNEEICKLRDKLNESIRIGEDYSIIYKLSIELDELIAQYYKKEKAFSKWLLNLFCKAGIYLVEKYILAVFLFHISC